MRFKYDSSSWEKYGGYPLPAFQIPELERLVKLGLSAQMLGTMLLGGYSSAIGTKYVGKCRGRLFFANIYALNVSESGNYKSLIFEIFGKHLERLQAEMDNDITGYHQQMELLGEKKKEHPRYGEVEINKFQKFYINGGTIEGVLDKISRYHLGTTIGLDEAYTFFQGMGQYKKGDSAEKQYYIQLFENILPTIVTKHGKDYKQLQNVCLTIFGNITVSKIARIFDINDDDGFKERFIFGYEPDRKLTDLPSDNYEIKHVNECLTNIFDQRSYQNEIEIPEYCDDLIRAWANDKARYTKNDSYLQKLKKYYFKFVILLYVIRGETKVTPDVAEYALHLIEFYYRNYCQLFRFETEDPLSKLTEKQKKLYEMLPNSFQFKQATDCRVLSSPTSVTKFLNNRDLFTKIEKTYWKNTALEDKN